MQRRRIREALLSCALLLSACEHSSQPTEAPGAPLPVIGVVGGKNVMIMDLTGSSENGQRVWDAITHVSVAPSGVAAVAEIWGEQAYVVCKEESNSATVMVKWDHYAPDGWEKETAAVPLQCKHNQGGGG